MIKKLMQKNTLKSLRDGVKLDMEDELENLEKRRQEERIMIS